MKSKLLDNVFVITLPHRLDRQKYINDQFSKHKISFIFFQGVNGHELDSSSNLLKGEEGIRQSHIKLLEFAKSNNLKEILIFEDDVVLEQNYTKIFQDTLDALPESDLIYFGAAHKQQPIYFKNNIYKVTNSVCLHSVYIKNTIFDQLLISIKENPNSPVDDVYALLQPSINAYCVYPPIAWQLDDYSDIQNKFVSYSWLKPK